MRGNKTEYVMLARKHRDRTGRYVGIKAKVVKTFDYAGYTFHVVKEPPNGRFLFDDIYFTVSDCGLSVGNKTYNTVAKAHMYAVKALEEKKDTLRELIEKNIRYVEEKILLCDIDYDKEA